MELLHIPTGHFEGYLDAKKHSIAHVFEKYSEALDKDLKYLKHCLNDVHSANVTQECKTAYREGFWKRLLRSRYETNLHRCLADLRLAQIPFFLTMRSY